MSFNRCKDIHKFGNKYLPLADKKQVEFRSHFSGKKVRLTVREIRYIIYSTLWLMFLSGFMGVNTTQDAASVSFLQCHHCSRCLAIICTQPRESS